MYIDENKHLPNLSEGEHYGVLVESNDVTWIVRRNLEHFVLLDRQLHYCVFDRGYSKLPDLELFTMTQPVVCSLYVYDRCVVH